MIDLKHCIAVGTIAKTYGVRGQVLLRLKNTAYGNLKNMESVFIEIDGLPVPFFIDDYDYRNNNEIILTIEDIRTEADSRILLGNKVWLHADTLESTAPKNTYDQPLPTGYEVIDSHAGKIGTLEEVLEFEQNPLLRILDGKNEILIPLQAEFVREVDDAAKIIFVDTPEGLIDLYRNPS